MAVISNIYPNAMNEATGPLIKRGPDVSVQVAVISGVSVGTYQLQSSNDGETFVNEGSAINSASITEFVVKKQVVKVVCTSPPTGGTGVKVTLYADAPGE